MGEKRNGLILVNTGNGKGKTTAALGMAFRAWGQGMKVLVLQFIKGGWKYGELKAAEKLGPNFEMRQMGEGFIKGPGDQSLEEHRQAAQEALEAASVEISSGKYDLIILDEILYAVNYGLVSLDDVLGLMKKKPESLHLVLTGRNAPPEVIERADLVTEMKEIKHHYTKGIPAQKGIEF
ncbi:cob(I)yrinic acid a,c-diamide adenosyltransferase [Pelotomaculum propionicicum]|uniref:Cob(I)yrinic acid a,c-diamide adenosyltransferase n=1 Tax=Pelotomaculum propionicicum TaxID=258475 RepID=A0A4Y7RT87_9FIRM|nr:cob(I)yrinic acid a,c-diamide adenosyltransferase [Pelotomaculum propionicicum]NLI12525.1 cob(I)yrinic acid a,c-diamide adenosyltransferase [Peptococcaceae bacterium]TEB12224.1 Cob(I)yrinic acid a,c-diamide adenosyltransferase [Pelotomaculum propionicicum]